MQRRPHFLKRNKTCTLPKHILCFDTETRTVNETETTKPQEMKLWTGVFHRRRIERSKDETKWNDGETSDQLADFVLSHITKSNCLYVFSANIWFDLRVSGLLDRLTSTGFEIKSFFANQKSFQMVLKTERKTIRLLNIQNIFPTSVKQIGKVVGLEKYDVDFDTVSDQDLLKYCYRDTEIIYRAMMYWFDFIQDNDFGRFGITLPTQAFNAYRHRFMPCQIGIHNNETVLDLEREGYFGGRCECYFIGKIKRRKVYSLDINSQYPSIMLSEYFPHILKATRKDCPLSLVDSLLDKYCIVARVLLDTDEPVYAKKENGKTIFPIGTFTTVLQTGSFKYAWEKGHIKRIDRIAIYHKAKLFTSWVKEIYALRQSYKAADNETLEQMCKLLLNSLYGKWAQRNDEVIEETVVDEEQYKSERIFDMDNNRWLMEIIVGNHRKLIQRKAKEGFNSFAAISAHVTDYARLLLWDLIKTGGIENVYYTDTDSLYVNHQGKTNLAAEIDPARLGALKVEKIADNMEIHTCKDYVFGSNKVMKGVRESAEEVKPGVFKQDFFPGIATELKEGITGPYTIRTITKKFSRVYDKGIISASGRVSPLVLSE